MIQVSTKLWISTSWRSSHGTTTAQCLSKRGKKEATGRPLQTQKGQNPRRDGKYDKIHPKKQGDRGHHVEKQDRNQTRPQKENYEKAENTKACNTVCLQGK